MNSVIAQGAPNSIIRFFQNHPNTAYRLFAATCKGDVIAQEKALQAIIDLALKEDYLIPSNKDIQSHEIP